MIFIPVVCVVGRDGMCVVRQSHEVAVGMSWMRRRTTTGRSSRLGYVVMIVSAIGVRCCGGDADCRMGLPICRRIPCTGWLDQAPVAGVVVVVVVGACRSAAMLALASVLVLQLTAAGLVWLPVTRPLFALFRAGWECRRRRRVVGRAPLDVIRSAPDDLVTDVGAVRLFSAQARTPGGNCLPTVCNSVYVGRLLSGVGVVCVWVAVACMVV